MSASILIALASALLWTSTAFAQDVLSTARDLYASAAYEEALAALGRVTSEATSESGVEVDRYRVLCLMALGRAPEAERVIESIVAVDPFYQPDPTDAAPRVRAAYSSVRQRLLPGVARGLYVEAKAAFDRKAYPEAVRALEKTVKVIDNIEAANRAELADLRVLASGFLDLSRASAEPPPVAAIATAPAEVEVPPAPEQPVPPASVPVPASTSLVVLNQDFPPLPFSLTSSGRGEYRGIIEVDISETGSVTNARMIATVHAFYDPLLLRASRDWKYEPPRVFGKAIPSRKRVEIVLRP